MKKKSVKRAKTVEKLIVKTWSSLESHMIYTHKKVIPPESNSFHQKCIKEYSEMLVLLSTLY